MFKYPYSVWFRDQSMVPSDQDFEWVACMLIEAELADKALSWGNHLARKFCENNPEQQFLSSSVEAPGTWDGLPQSEETPTITFGHEASDEEIGW